MAQPALEADPEDREILQENTRLRREIAGLEQELAEAKAEAQKFKTAALDSVHAVRALRKLLDPFHQAIGMIYGEVSRVDVGGPEEPTVRVVTGLWQERIAKAGTQQGRILQVLLDGGGAMSHAQIRSAARTGGNTAAVLSQLIARNWVERLAHGQYTLKG